MRLREAISLAFFLVYLGLQVAIPLRELSVPYQSRWGWKMYAMREKPVRFVAALRDGSEVRIDDLFARDGVARLLHSAVDARRFVPPHLCRNLPGTVRVQVFDPSREATTWSCP